MSGKCLSGNTTRLSGIRRVEGGLRLSRRSTRRVVVDLVDKLTRTRRPSLTHTSREQTTRDPGRASPSFGVHVYKRLADLKDFRRRTTNY